MRRADRLFQIIQLLRGRRRAVTASQLAERLGVSERTVYRDVRDLIATGTPIDGEAGVGYSLHRDYDLPPLMFDTDEIEALVLGARVAAAFADESLARAARSALSKIEAIAPPRLKARFSDAALYAPRTGAGERVSMALHVVRFALNDKRKLQLRYRDGNASESERVVRPLGAFFWGKSWTLAGWCELRQDFRVFRLDRMLGIEATEDSFEDEPGRTLRDYLSLFGDKAVRLLEQ
jgi:predicted DNA-binding transcriptional regulator YafY